MSFRGARPGAERTTPLSARIGGLRTMSRALAPHSDLFGARWPAQRVHRVQLQGLLGAVQRQDPVGVSVRNYM